MTDFEDAIEDLVGPVDFDPQTLQTKYHAERNRRLRDDGDAQYVEMAGRFAAYDDDPYTERRERMSIEAQNDIVIVGGGFGGVLAAGRLREAGFTNIRVIEKGSEFGGTWYWNRYPGAMCDVESYCYLPMLETVGTVPKHRYSYAPEILAHAQRLAQHFGLYEQALLQTTVTEVRWADREGVWVVKTDRGDRIRARFLVMANGPLSRPKLPGITGIERFKGNAFHTSRWDYTYTGGNNEGQLVKLHDKRVGIIGTGASAIQCVPHLGASAEFLYVFQRTPSSVDARDNRETDPEWVATLAPGWQSERIRNFTAVVAGGDEDVDLVADGWTDIFRNLTGQAAKRAQARLGRRLTPQEKGRLMEVADYQKMNAIRRRIEESVDDPRTAELLKPWYRQFCKRPCFHDEYLPTFNRPNVALVDTGGRGVDCITENGVVVGQKEYAVDCLIYATGFEVGVHFTRRAGYEVIGRGEVSLTDHWRRGPRTLHGLQTAGFPNCFFIGMVQGAHTVNLPHLLDEQAKHVAYILVEVRSRGRRMVEATVEGENTWLAEIRRKAAASERFLAECTPGYYNDEGRVGNPFGNAATVYGGGPLKFFGILANWRAAGTLEGCELHRR